MPGKEFEWFRENYKFLQERYSGKVVAISGNKVVGIGNNLQEADLEAKKRASGRLFFGRVRKKSAMIL